MKGFQDHSPSISLTVLGTLCFVTLIMSQTRFKVSKEMSQDLHPPVLRTKDSWFLYSIGNPDCFKCVLRAFIVITSPVLSFISTALLLFGKIESNPYFFIPWLFLTIKGLLLIQMENLITIIRDMGNRKNFVFGFQLEDLKWFIFYCSIFMIDMIEVFSFCEIFDLFLVLWNHHPGYNLMSVNLEAVKKEIADIMEALSKCSLGSLSKISLGNGSDSDGDSEYNLVVPSLGKLSLNLKENEKVFDDNEQEGFSKGDPTLKKFSESENKNILLLPSLKSIYEGDTSNAGLSDTENLVRTFAANLNEMDLLKQDKLQRTQFSKISLKGTSKSETECPPLE